MKILNDVSMKNYTTYKTGGIVRTMYFPENENELKEFFDEIIVLLHSTISILKRISGSRLSLIKVSLLLN